MKTRRDFVTNLPSASFLSIEVQKNNFTKNLQGFQNLEGFATLFF
jgi:hypothetical protein